MWLLVVVIMSSYQSEEGSQAPVPRGPQLTHMPKYTMFENVTCVALHRTISKSHGFLLFW